MVYRLYGGTNHYRGKHVHLDKIVDYLGLSFFFLGVLGKLAIVIFKINEKKKSTEFEN